MFVKICGITNADDALHAVEHGADAVGLIFAASTRQVTVDVAREIVSRVPAEVLTVGVFRNQDRNEVVRIANEVGVGAVQLSGEEPLDDVRWIAERVPAVINAFGIDDPGLVVGGDDGSHRLMVDSAVPGSGQTFDWDLLAERTGGRPYILAGGLDPDNIAAAITGLRPWGVDVASGVEREPGIKDPAAVERFLRAAREAYQGLGV